MIPTRRQWRSWSKPSKLTAIGVLLAFIFWILPQPTFLWNWIPDSELVATVESGPFQLPQALITTFTETYAISDEDFIQENIDLEKRLEYLNLEFGFLTEDEGKNRLKESINSRFSLFLRRNLPSEIPYEFSSISGYWQATIENKTSRTLKGVVLVLPSAEMAEIRRSNEEPEFLITSEKIQIGSLAPKEVLTMFSWAGSDYSDRLEPAISLTHENGIGDIRLKKALSPFWVWLDRYLLRYLYAAIWGLFMFFSVYNLAVEISKKNAAK